MGEVMVSSEDLEVVRTEEEQRMGRNQKDEERDDEDEDGGGGSSGLENGLVRWENLLPKMVLSVLLVEADDSTRQIIAALLRKCCYRVAAVPDGLKAWEVLKGRPHDIDLILTEVELPSISGYALLTLIMEHDVCKNIPVIMTSSQDSVSAVYKCMLRGAADYLVKPIRRNELKNLWQHVWRRQSSLGGIFPPDGSTRKDKAEGTSENNAASNNACGDVGSFQRSKEYIEKGSDAQSSCFKPEMEAESAQVEGTQDLVQPLRGIFPNDKDIQLREIHTSTGSSAAVYTSSFILVGNNAEAENQRLKDVEASKGHNDDNATANYREPIDFMGTSNDELSSKNADGKLWSFTHLDLTLRGSHFGGSYNEIVEERNMLRHSSASAFTRYSSKCLRPFFPTLLTFNKAEQGVNSVVPITQRSSSSQRLISIQVPSEGMTFDKLHSSYGSVFPPMLCKQPNASPTPSPSPAGQRESTPRAIGYHYPKFEDNSSHLHYCPSRNTNESTNQNSQVQVHGTETLDLSAGSGFCNGALSRINSMGLGSACGSNSNLDPEPPVRATADSKSEENVLGQNQNCHRSIQREAALTKFRLKRKDRCYEKKVRYESRRKLAEQRPRVKGQFVRQGQADPPHVETS